MRRLRMSSTLQAHVLTAALGVVVLVGTAVAVDRTASLPTKASAASCSVLPGSLASAPPAVSLGAAAAAVAPSVVSLTATSNAQVSTGSGIVIRSDGLILTNNHVVAATQVNGGDISVTFPNGHTSKATVIGRIPKDDIAVVRTTHVQRATPAQLGSSDTLRIGDTVLAIGNALGQQGTVTSGIVSALDRTACVTSETSQDASNDIFGTQPALPDQTDLHGLIQTDAPINPGNSGGALVDLTGRVVGLITLGMGVGGSGGSVGIGFAIPIERAYADASALVKSAT